jgi:hypothetical protein
MSYWHRNKAGDLVPWPLRHNRWDHVVVDPSELPPGGFADWLAEERFRDEYAKKHEERVRAAMEIVGAAIEADPVTAGARFALHHTLCFCCGKPLTEDQSKAYGIGPDCRRDMDPDTLAQAVELTAKMHGALEAASRQPVERPSLHDGDA